jgi:hypothetical protein
VASRLEHHRPAGVYQALHELIYLFLQEWLTSRDLNQWTIVPVNNRDNVIDSHLVAFEEGIGRVAPGTAQVAGRQADEHAWPAGARRLALNRIEDFVHREHALLF